MFIKINNVNYVLLCVPTMDEVLDETFFLDLQTPATKIRFFPPPVFFLEVFILNSKLSRTKKKNLKTFNRIFCSLFYTLNT